MSFPLCKVSVSIQMSGTFSNTIFWDSILQFLLVVSEGGEQSCAWPSSLPEHTQLQEWRVDACLPQVKLSLQSFFFAIWNWKPQSIILTVFLDLQPESTGQKLCYLIFFLFPIAILLPIQSSSPSLIAHFEKIQISMSPEGFEVTLMFS